MSLAACAFEPSGPLEPGDDDVEPDPGIPTDVDAGVVEQPPDPPPPDPLPPPTVECRVEGDNLGIVGLQVISPRGTYTFDRWEKSHGNLVGFTLTGPDNARYEVRTDHDHFMIDSLVYSGEATVMRVDFCVTSGD
jgi:hypothetical protein